ncbi:N-acetyltransferase [Ktedonobacter sp. SOSP1-52]|uniref:GNAT family N-acetyltransferase n=1 Tax=Ktedonobacter sp. SOSP1-52 TaxID=2778366 RepID=UPI001915EDF3|nr:GNAT family N-acetyltransferase [Ktedonobacter sp. SOSP1-52]GHO62856.1 N-acetyltransferase [Ktedonobacter sp. SOSP1-52]
MLDYERCCVRPISRHDLEAVIDLCGEHAAYEGARYDPQGKVEALARALFATPPRLYAWVVEQGGHLLGYATATQEFSTWDAASFLHMDCLYLREEARGMGLGRLLMMEIARLARQLGCVNVQWQTPEWNEHAIRFYQRLGAIGKQKVRFVFAREAFDTFLATERGKNTCPPCSD